MVVARSAKLKTAPRRAATAAPAPRSGRVAKSLPPAPVVPPIGAKLRHARLLRRMRLEDVAQAAGCSPSMVSKIENDRVSPSLTTLHHLCRALDMSVTTLFAAPGLSDRVVLRRGDRPVIGNAESSDRKGAKAEVLVPHAEGRLLEGFIVILEPGAGSEGDLQHRGEEVGYVLEGTLELTVSRETFRLETGDSFCFRSDERHAYRNPGRQTTRVVWINTPPSL